MGETARAKSILTVIAAALFAAIFIGLIWFFVGASAPVGFGWYIFSFAAGLSMIVLPCTLPLAFVIVPLSMGKGPMKGLGIALTFGLGVALMLSTYGILAAIIGQVAIGSLGAPLEVVKNWLYFIAGGLAYLFALGELGFIKLRMPTYTGAAPAFIQKQQDYVKAFLLGLFLGNIGVGCPHPATPVILTRIAVSGDVFYGWLLFFVHALGRVLPLVLLAILGILGVNALTWLTTHKDKVERATGWGMVFVASFILVLGLFSHDWWVYSGQHTLLEEFTGEEKLLGLIISRFNFAGVPHAHGVPTGTGLFGLPLALGNWVLVLLWILPIWWAYWLRRKKAEHLPDDEKKIDKAVAPVGAIGLLTLSLVLVVMIVFVLPDRFYTRATMEGMADHHEGQEETSVPHEEEGGHGESESGMMMDDHQDTTTHEDEEHGAQKHDASDIREGLAIDLTLLPARISVTSSTLFDFFVNEKPAHTPVTNLEVSHEKPMHVIGVRDDLNEFFHIHPVATSRPGHYEVRHRFGMPGAYKIWSEVVVDGVNHVFGHPVISVTGAGNTSEKEVTLKRIVSVAGYQVAIDYSTLLAAKPMSLVFDIHGDNGEEIEVEPYLGADMHLSIIKEDLSEFVHTHPEDASHGHSMRMPIVGTVFAHTEGEGETDQHDAMMEPSSEDGIQFSATFPTSGMYKAFAQFRPKGSTLPPDEALLATFWLKVEEKGHVSPAAAWWLLLVTSLIAMGGLSYATYRYVHVLEGKKP